MSGREYVNFDAFKSVLGSFSNFFSSVSIKIVKRISLRKINMMEFNNIQDNKLGYTDVILNKALLINSDIVPSTNLQQGIQTLNYAIGDWKLDFKYGIVSPTLPEKVKPKVVLDIDIANIGEINQENVESTLLKINQQVFNVFSWSLSDSFKKFMNE